MIYWFVLRSNFQCILKMPLLNFQNLDEKSKLTKAIGLTKLTCTEFNINIAINTQVADKFDRICWYDIIYGTDSLDKFGFSIN